MTDVVTRHDDGHGPADTRVNTCPHGHPVHSVHPHQSYCMQCGAPLSSVDRRPHIDEGDEDSPRVVARPPAGERSDARAGRGRRLAAVVVLLVVVAGVVFAGERIAEYRLSAARWLDIGQVRLTADPIPIGTATGGVVAAVDVAPQQRVVSGQPLTDVATSVLGPGGAPVSSSTTLRAPTSGVVVSVDQPAGSVTTNGQPILTMYDPERLNLVGAVSASQLDSIRLGMTAQISGFGLSRPLAARVARVVPAVGPQPSTSSSSMTLVLTPVDEGSVADLVPGLGFSAKVDSRSGHRNDPTGVQLG